MEKDDVELNPCLNTNEPKAIYICEHCGNDIFAGDSYMDYHCGAICEECMDDMNAYELADFLGWNMAIAQEQEGA